MADRPIIFSAPMVRALLAGRKTQTRRLATSPLARCAPRDRLYVREGWRRAGWCPASYTTLGGSGMAVDVEYLADGEKVQLRDPGFDIEKAHGSGIPSIHMPRWASRLTLIVEDVRVERLREIGNADARAEGVEKVDTLPMHDAPWRDYTGRTAGAMSAKESFATLWQSLHGLDSWAENPFVVALTFSVVRENIDRIAA